ncbi:4Fe-4S dicluster domain-containing protein [Methanobrevibacter sp. TMH8]|uniref:4Fe-4S dicluster domain-containing protein n=1 Tax=Methanobrevibacter sp. TMH8 TaxID=2848611 RepID=UPI001CCABC8F|nr:4Fe-4S dicluster domain-containing protein [Methanobrevibacter sp. TMH8]MBZ9570364.1 4Fe-4S dicluster domain-containing protein [Methanobrevibacter sp. TMH8]
MVDESTMGCCCEQTEEDNPYEKDISSCCCDYEVTDDSKVENPKSPKKEIDLETLNKVKEMSKSLDIGIIAFGKIPKEEMKENKKLKYSNAIVFTMKIGKKIINEPPSVFAQELNDLVYDKFGKSLYILSDYLRENGFETQVAHPHQNLLDLGKLGETSGIGTVGRSHLLITPEFGPCQKIGAILTSIENLTISKENTYKWINNYCKRCGKCIKACPEDALQKEYMDENKANFIESKCLGCNQGCTYCIEECPFYKDGYSYVKEKHDKLEAKLNGKRKL